MLRAELEAERARRAAEAAAARRAAMRREMVEANGEQQRLKVCSIKGAQGGRRCVCVWVGGVCVGGVGRRILRVLLIGPNHVHMQAHSFMLTHSPGSPPARTRTSNTHTRAHAQSLQAERLAAERAQECEFRRRMMERLAAEDRLAQQRDAQRRQRAAEHAREVERVVQYRRELYEAIKVRFRSFCGSQPRARPLPTHAHAHREKPHGNPPLQDTKAPFAKIKFKVCYPEAITR
jgi:hypothetical protein